MPIGRPFLITMMAVGYIGTALFDLLTASGLLGDNPWPAIVSGSRTNLIILGVVQFILGLALFKGARWAWWLVFGGACIPIFTHVAGGVRGEPWGWGTIFWNLAVLAYLQSRDVQAFFGREAY